MFDAGDANPLECTPQNDNFRYMCPAVYRCFAWHHNKKLVMVIEVSKRFLHVDSNELAIRNKQKRPSGLTFLAVR